MKAIKAGFKASNKIISIADVDIWALQNKHDKSLFPRYDLPYIGREGEVKKLFNESSSSFQRDHEPIELVLQRRIR